MRGSELMVDVNCGVGRAGAAEEEVAAVSMREREREDERDETTLRTRSRRLLDDDDDVSGRWLLSNPRVLLEVGMGVGIPLSDSGAVELLRLDKAPGRLRSLGAEEVACSL